MAVNIAERNRKIWEAVKKGDIAVSDLISDGGYLPPEQENRFMRKVYESTRPLDMIRRVEMNSPKRRIHKIGITDNFLHKAPDSGTALDSAKRNKVFTEYVELTTQELIGSMYIPYDVIEDNIERGAIEDTIMNDILPPKVGRDLVKTVFQGDTLSADTLLASLDGVCKQLNTGSNKVTFDQVTGAVDDDLWQDILDYLPYAHRENETSLNYIIHPSTHDAWYRKRRLRLTAEGDAILNVDHMVDYSFRGIPIVKTPWMPSTKGVLTNPQNIILGVQRGITFETARDIEARMIIIVVTMRVAVGIEEKEACVLADGINPSGTTSTTSTTTT